MRFLLAALLLIVLASLSAQAEESAPKKNALDPRGDYQGELSEPVTYDLELAAIVTAPYHTKTLKVWLPLPPRDRLQQVESRGFHVFPNDIQPVIAEENVHGNRFAYFEIDHPQGAQIIRHTLRVTTHEVRWNIDRKKIAPPADWPPSFAPYLKSDQAVVINDQVRDQLQKIVGAGADAGLSPVFAWARDHLRYDHSRASLQASSLHALEIGGGHCSDYHGLCSALGRALGYPTRVTYGLNLFPKNSPSHCKLEAYLPPYGWVSFDVSETQRLVQAIEKDEKLSPQERDRLRDAAIERFERGFRDNTWLLQTRGTGYDLAPPASRKVNVVRTIYAEADGEPLPEPDPADATRREFAWQIGLKIEASRAVKYPFKHP